MTMEKGVARTILLNMIVARRRNFKEAKDEKDYIEMAKVKNEMKVIADVMERLMLDNGLVEHEKLKREIERLPLI